jgi:hypothetical protein
MTRRRFVVALLAAASLAAQPKPGGIPKAVKDRLQKMPPKDRERLERRYQNFQKLPPAEQERTRAAFRRFQELPEERRAKVRTAWDRLQDMPPEDRKKFLNSPQFKNRFNDQERSILSDLASTLP